MSSTSATSDLPPEVGAAKTKQFPAVASLRAAACQSWSRETEHLSK